MLKIIALGLALMAPACARMDTNGYYAKGGSTGRVTCTGVCP